MLKSPQFGLRNLSEETKQIMELYEVWLEKRAPTVYNIAQPMITDSGVVPTIGSVEEFTEKTLHLYQDREKFTNSGLFLSLIANLAMRNKDDVINLYLRNLNTPLDYIGSWMERGKIIIQKDAGNHVGEYMRGGQVVIKGDAGEWVGDDMHGGRIVVYGNVKDWLGNCMTGGLIEVLGNAERLIGMSMSGGKIIVYENNIGYIELTGKEKVYIKGKLFSKKD